MSNRINEFLKEYNVECSYSIDTCGGVIHSYKIEHNTDLILTLIDLLIMIESRHMYMEENDLCREKVEHELERIEEEEAAYEYHLQTLNNLLS